MEIISKFGKLIPRKLLFTLSKALDKRSVKLLSALPNHVPDLGDVSFSFEKLANILNTSESEAQICANHLADNGYLAYTPTSVSGTIVGVHLTEQGMFFEEFERKRLSLKCFGFLVGYILGIISTVLAGLLTKLLAG